MQLQLSFPEPMTSLPKISHLTPILLFGSCFSENIGKKLTENKFPVLSNPKGILFSPLALAQSLKMSLSGKIYQEEDLIFHQGVYHHWDFHSSFSALSASEALKKMNKANAVTAGFLKNAQWLVFTLGTAFQYYYLEEGVQKFPVANCHKLPANCFEKRLSSIPEICQALDEAIQRARITNPKLKIIFTISPVRHLRDGLIENNHSKARLIESVHILCEQLPDCFYFPAYEILMDSLRDYRFYDADMTHPGILAKEIIGEQFEQFFYSAETISLTTEIKKIRQACLHKPLFPGSPDHQEFIKRTLRQITHLSQAYPFLDFEAEQKALLGRSRRSTD